jgi:hypothetical protein
MFDLTVPEQESSIEVEKIVNKLRMIEADAARFRWLRDRGFDFSDLETLSGEDLDREIDSRCQVCSDSILLSLFLGVPVGEVGKLAARLRELEADSTRYQWIRN